MPYTPLEGELIPGLVCPECGWKIQFIYGNYHATIAALNQPSVVKCTGDECPWCWIIDKRKVK